MYSQEPWRAGHNYYRLDGSTSAQERERLITSFNADPTVKLFLVSTRAGSLGVNLVGANRVVIFDASWNPCHDTQAVCRVYRYGQDKATHVYRLVTDNSLEKKIYDRQVHKEGMADRIVDELNPDAHLSSREVHSLICDEEEDPAVMSDVIGFAQYSDPVLRAVLTRFPAKLTKPPFAHESLLVDRKDNKLSRAEKRLAEKAYKLERTSKITYSRPSYAAFYPKPGSFATNLNNPGSTGYSRNKYYEKGKKIESLKPVASVRPLPMDPYTHVESAFPIPSFSNVLSAPPDCGTSNSSSSEWRQRVDRQGGVSQQSSLQQMVTGSAGQNKDVNTTTALQALAKQGVGLQQLTVPRDLTIPTGQDSPPVSLRAGETVMVIKTPKGIYLKMEEKIIKIKQPLAVQGLLGLPGGNGETAGTGRGGSSSSCTETWS